MEEIPAHIESQPLRVVRCGVEDGRLEIGDWSLGLHPPAGIALSAHIQKLRTRQRIAMGAT
jgi:hypothetical protein